MTPPAAIVLRSFVAADDAALRATFDDLVTAVWNVGHGIDDLEAWRTTANTEDETAVSWAVAAPDDDRLLGTVALFHIDADQGTGEVGYRVVPAERGRGVATAALAEATRRAFTDRGLRRVQLYHAVGNASSCRVAERAGYLLEGRLRSSYRYGDGEIHDEHLHARLATDPPPAG